MHSLPEATPDPCPLNTFSARLRRNSSSSSFSSLSPPASASCRQPSSGNPPYSATTGVDDSEKGANLSSAVTLNDVKSFGLFARASLHETMENMRDSSLPSSSDAIVSPTPKSSMKLPAELSAALTFKYGEFAAFGDVHTAVIDMIVLREPCCLIVGGQNGSLLLFNLQTHRLVRTINTREASITCMATDPEQKLLFVCYYDKMLFIYNTRVRYIIYFR
ncbi:unnamed protein product [Protopolystoma xenopodis]|uniref:Uncharacterized protein n=1 Tax=Protopolystoma xenopodis TaxID=117903 RepID=A0A3S5BH32_9PLAT|nr:unnamed protein product [Protopolystoma xenopodis]